MINRKSVNSEHIQLSMDKTQMKEFDRKKKRVIRQLRKRWDANKKRRVKPYTAFQAKVSRVVHRYKTGGFDSFNMDEKIR